MRTKNDFEKSMRFSVLLLLVFGLLFIHGCARYPSLPELKEGVSVDTQNSTDGIQFEEKMRKILLSNQKDKFSKDYIIGQGDNLHVDVWKEPELSRKVTVSPNGGFPYPLLENVNCEGLTVAELEKQLTNSLKGRFLLNPQVTISVTNYASKSVHVLGAVPNVGKFPLKARTTLLEILTEAGGLKEDAGFECIIIRPGEKQGKKSPTTTENAQQEDVISVNLTELMKGDLLQNVELQHGDTIFIPGTQHFFVYGEVKKPGKYKFDKKITVLKAITEAGGTTEEAASLKRVRIIREERGKKTRIQAKPTDSIKPQDIIIVPESFF